MRPTGPPWRACGAFGKPGAVDDLESLADRANFQVHVFLSKMTSHDHNMAMKGIGIAELKARLSEHLRLVRKGRTLTVLDRDTPIARIVPYQSEVLEVRRATRRASEIKLPSRAVRPTDSLAILLSDRGRR